MLYIEFKNATVTTRRLDDDIAIDYDEKGEIAGIEVLSASRRLMSEETPPRIILENLLPV